MAAFTQDLQAYGGDAAQIEHVCMGMSAAYLKGVRQSMPEAAISYDRNLVAAMMSQAMGELQSTGLRQDLAKLKQTLELGTKTRRSLRWAMHALHRSGLKKARTW